MPAATHPARQPADDIVSVDGRQSDSSRRSEGLHPVPQENSDVIGHNRCCRRGWPVRFVEGAGIETAPRRAAVQRGDSPNDNRPAREGGRPSAASATPNQ